MTTTQYTYSEILCAVFFTQ